MDDVLKFVLERLDHTLTDERTLAQWVIGLTITFALAVLVGKRNLVRPFPSRESLILAAILLLFIGAYWWNLDRGRRQAVAWHALATEWAQQNDAKVGGHVKAVLDKNIEMSELTCNYWARLLVPSFVLVACWIFLADIDELIRPNPGSSDQTTNTT
jgi:hypothetical protein